MRKILAELVRINLCQLCPASEGASISDNLMLVFFRTGKMGTFSKIGLIASGGKQCLKLLSPDSGSFSPCGQK